MCGLGSGPMEGGGYRYTCNKGRLNEHRRRMRLTVSRTNTRVLGPTDPVCLSQAGPHPVLGIAIGTRTNLGLNHHPRLRWPPFMPEACQAAINHWGRTLLMGEGKPRHPTTTDRRNGSPCPHHASCPTASWHTVRRACVSEQFMNAAPSVSWPPAKVHAATAILCESFYVGPVAMTRIHGARHPLPLGRRATRTQRRRPI